MKTASYATAGETLPDAVHQRTVWPVILGGGIGIVRMLLRHFTEGAEEGPTGLVAVSGLDALIDGLVLETSWGTAAFFVGFLTLTVVSEMMPS